MVHEVSWDPSTLPCLLASPSLLRTPRVAPGSAFLTPALLLGYAAAFAAADAAADLAHHDAVLAEDCAGYGVKGKVGVAAHGISQGFIGRRKMNLISLMLENNVFLVIFKIPNASMLLSVHLKSAK